MAGTFAAAFEALAVVVDRSHSSVVGELVRGLEEEWSGILNLLVSVVAEVSVAW